MPLISTSTKGAWICLKQASSGSFWIISRARIWSCNFEQVTSMRQDILESNKQALWFSIKSSFFRNILMENYSREIYLVFSFRINKFLHLLTATNNFYWKKSFIFYVKYLSFRKHKKYIHITRKIGVDSHT